MVANEPNFSATTTVPIKSRTARSDSVAAEVRFHGNPADFSSTARSIVSPHNPAASVDLVEYIKPGSLDMAAEEYFTSTNSYSINHHNNNNPSFNPDSIHSIRRTSSGSLQSARKLQLVYRNCQYTVKTNKGPNGENLKIAQDKLILKGVSGVFEPGRLTAIIGSSGAGKTSLLNTVSLRPTVGISTGEILVNGELMTASRMKLLSAFVYQDDIILPTMTVRESLTMSALLRLPSSMPISMKLARVEEVIAVLQLRKCADTVIGSATMKGISGGEKRRVSVGIEMITNPSILFLDEPTSGLDTYTAYSIISTLRAVAHKQLRTIICTIHQPSSDIFHMFDDLVLMAAGEIMYNGPVDKVVQYFSRIGYQCPRFTNPSDFMFMSVLNATIPPVTNNSIIHIKQPSNQSKPPLFRNQSVIGLTITERVEAAKSADKAENDRIDSLLNTWHQSVENRLLDDKINNPYRGPLPTSAELQLNNSSFLTEYKLLARRAWYNQLRNKMMVRARFGQSLFMAVLVGLIYLQLANNQRGVQDRLGGLFFVIVNMLMSSVFSVQNAFGAEKAVFLREYGSGMYSIASYFLSRTVVELPFKLIIPLLGCAINYWMVGFQADVGKFFLYVIIFILVDICGSAFGIFITCLFPDLHVSLAVTPMIILPIMVISGFLSNANNIPPYINWLSFVSPIRYGYQSLIKNEFTGLTVYCSPNEFTGPMSDTCRYTAGEQVIEQMGFANEPSIAENLIIIAGLSIAYLFLAYAALWRATKKIT